MGEQLMATAEASQPSDEDPVYFNRPGVALVTWNRDLRAACLESQGWADTRESQAALDAVIRALKAHRGSRCLVDNRKKAIRAADQAWIAEDWLPRAVGAGLRLTAIVELESGPATVTIKEVEVRYFSTVVRAAEWLTDPPAAA
jgi:hypothetical protein